MKCEDDQSGQAEAPVVGCGCHACYRTRELGLDPRLKALAQPSIRMPSYQTSLIVRHWIDGYLGGRVDYGALHLGIITALVELGAKQFEDLSRMAMARTPMMFLSDKPWPPNLDKVEGDGT